MNVPEGLLVLGVDPGTAATGYGLVVTCKGVQRAVHYGVIEPAAGLPSPERLRFIHVALSEVVHTWRPHEVAVEDFYVGHPRAAVAIGEVRAMALLAAAQANLPVSLYKPLEVKQFVTSYGRGSKEQVQAMVCALLGLDPPPPPPDAADALAVALCHCLKRQALAASSVGRGGVP